MTNRDFQCSHGCADQGEHDVWFEDMLIGAIDASGPNAAQIQAALGYTRGDLDKAQKILARIQGRRPDDVPVMLRPGECVIPRKDFEVIAVGMNSGPGLLTMANERLERFKEISVEGFALRNPDGTVREDSDKKFSIIINPPNTSTGVGKQIVELIDRMQKCETRYPSATYRHRWTEPEPDYLGSLAREIHDVCDHLLFADRTGCVFCKTHAVSNKLWSDHRETCAECTPRAESMTRLQRVAVGLEADPYPHLGGFSNDCEAAEARGWYENHLRPGNEREAHRRDLDRRSWDCDLPSDDFSGDDVCRYVGPEKR